MDDFRISTGSDAHSTMLARGLAAGAIVAGAGYIASGLLLELLWVPSVIPAKGSLSYGQQWAMFVAVAVGLGAACGSGAVLIWQSRWRAGLSLALAACATAASIACSLWFFQRSE